METARALTQNLAALLRREHDALAEFLVALADFDRRRLWVALGHASLFYYLHRELRLSKGAAQYRKVAAELIQEIPGVVEPLRQGRLCLSSVIEAAKVVTRENWETVLPRFYGLSKREAMEVVAELLPHPSPPARTVVTPVRPALAFATVASFPPVLELRDGSPEAERKPAAGWPVNQPAPASVPPVEVKPLTADQSRVHVTVSKAFMRKLEAARDAMSNAMPGATHAEILEAGLELLLAQAAKRKGMVERPRKHVRLAKGDHVPAHVKREVWQRDGGRCQWALDSGGVCGSTRHLELDHVHPKSMGGTSTVANLRVLCRAHNDLAARLALGDDLMDRYSSGLRGAAGRPSSPSSPPAPGP